MLQRIVNSQNNPTLVDVRMASNGYRTVWAETGKIRFALMGGKTVEMSVICVEETLPWMTIKGFVESGDGAEVYYNMLSGLGSVVFIPELTGEGDYIPAAY